MNDQVNPTFNPEQFLGMEVVGENATEYVLVPEGDYVGTCGPISADNFKQYAIKEGPNAGGMFRSLRLTWDLNDEGGALQELLGMPPKVPQGIRLDLNKDGSIDIGKGRNVDLGRLRTALNMNDGNTPFNFPNLGGQTARLKVKHRMDKKTNKVYSEVTEVSRL